MCVLGLAERQVVTTPEPGAFADEWLMAWNRHDVDAVLGHFHHGESVLVINYHDQSGGLVNEVLEFDGALVRRGHGTHLPCG